MHLHIYFMVQEYQGIKFSTEIELLVRELFLIERSYQR